MIKRTAALLLTMAYAITAVGFAFDVHYCFNRVVSVAINAPAKSCGMAASKSKCCKNSRVEVKVKDAHHAQSTTLLPVTFGFEIPRQSLSSYFVFEDHGAVINYDAPDPPPVTCANYLKNCVFRI